MQLRGIYPGEKCHVCVLVSDSGKSQFQDVFDEAQEDEQGTATVRIRYLGDLGRANPLSYSSQVDTNNHIWKFIGGKHFRGWFFVEGTCVIFTNARHKTQREQRDNDLARARRMKKQYELEKKAGGK